MIEVRRAGDDELCGWVDEHDGRWRALTVFGGVLGEYDDQQAATRHVREAGLASLAERWTLVDGVTGTEQTVCIQEASASHVTVALDFYSLPGVPTQTITSSDLAAARWQLRLD